jgi:hypothetical protein
MKEQKNGTGSGGNYLGRAIKKRMAEAIGGPNDAWDLATVLGDLSLQLDTYGVPIPKGEYMLCRSLILPPTWATSTEGDGTTWEHQHTVTRPEQLAPLKAGDRVAVAWINGTELLVIDVILSS